MSKRTPLVSKQLRRWLLDNPTADFTQFATHVGEPTALNLLARMEAYVADAELFDLFAAASFVEATLVMPSGRRVRFEWDKDDPAQLPLRALLAVLIADDHRPLKKLKENSK